MYFVKGHLKNLEEKRVKHFREIDESKKEKKQKKETKCQTQVK